MPRINPMSMVTKTRNVDYGRRREFQLYAAREAVPGTWLVSGFCFYAQERKRKHGPE